MQTMLEVRTGQRIARSAAIDVAFPLAAKQDRGDGWRGGKILRHAETKGERPRLTKRLLDESLRLRDQPFSNSIERRAGVAGASVMVKAL